MAKTDNPPISPRPDKQQRLEAIDAKLAEWLTPAGKARLAAEKLSALSAVPEQQLSPSMRWLVQDLKRRWQQAAPELIELECKSLQAEKDLLQAEIDKELANG